MTPEQTENLKLWDSVKRPPESVLSEIKGGRLSGFTDIDPIWRLETLTALFGPVGTGWTWTVGQPIAVHCEGQTALYVHGSLQIKNGDVWGEAFSGCGGCMAAKMESRGIFFDDDALKKAETDAISDACKKLGLAADIYKGHCKGSKYTDNEVPTDPLGGDTSGKGEAPKLTEAVIANIAQSFDAIGITQQELEEKADKTMDQWTDYDKTRALNFYKGAKKEYDAKQEG